MMPTSRNTIHLSQTDLEAQAVLGADNSEDERILETPENVSKLANAIDAPRATSDHDLPEASATDDPEDIEVIVPGSFSQPSGPTIPAMQPPDESEKDRNASFIEELKQMVNRENWAEFSKAAESLDIASDELCVERVDRSGRSGHWIARDLGDIKTLPGLRSTIMVHDLGVTSMTALWRALGIEMGFFCDYISAYHTAPGPSVKEANGSCWWHLHCETDNNGLPAFTPDFTADAVSIWFYLPQAFHASSVILMRAPQYQDQSSRMQLKARTAPQRLRRGDQLAARLNRRPNPSLDLDFRLLDMFNLTSFMARWLASQDPLHQKLRVLKRNFEESENILSTTNMLYRFAVLLTCEMWNDGVSALEIHADMLSSIAIQMPNFNTFSAMNHCRKELLWLGSAFRGMQGSPWRRAEKMEMYLANRCFMQVTESTSRKCFEILEKAQFDLGDRVREIPERITALDIALKETFTMLTQAVAVVDSDANKRIAKRATMLAVLSALYLPATLCTGMFGMNISQITKDPSQPEWTTVAYALLALTGISVLFIGIVFLHEKALPAVNRWVGRISGFSFGNSSVMLEEPHNDSGIL